MTRILVRFAPQDESPAFSFDATAEPGYVWHCHILEHEENDMMRPFHMVAPEPIVQSRAPSAGSQGAVSGRAALLLAAQPNPTRAGATIGFSLPTSGPVELDLLSVTGQRVRRLAGAPFEAGEHSLSWDGTDDGGRRVAPGVYFVNLRAGGALLSRKLFVAP